MTGRRARRLPGSWSSFAGSGPIYRPTVEFTTADGTKVTATSPFGTNPRPGHEGDTVTVLYDPRNPQRMRVETQSRWVGCMEAGFMLFGGVRCYKETNMFKILMRQTTPVI
ncbi:DUF3592 domain-containing protein [Lacticaseibacillus rhamnosus]